MSSLSQLIHGILETYTNDNKELDYDKIVILATFGLIILSIRSTLKIKDDNIKLEVEINNLKREIERLKKQKIS